MTSILARVAEARERLRAAGLSQAEADLGARLLAEHVLGWDRTRLLTSGTDTEPDGFAKRYGSLVERRTTREPLDYILGYREFWGLRFEVTPAVLVPRPETELIVEAALSLAPAGQLFTVIDTCTGSGNVAVAIAAERQDARVVATDISAAALEVAQRNAARHGVEGRVMFVQADLFDGVPGPVDLITANPPYVPQASAPGLQPEVGRYEPGVALFGGHDGLAIVQRILRDAPALIRPGGHLVFEFGFGQEVEIEELVASSGELSLVELKRDLQGLARTAVAVRR